MPNNRPPPPHPRQRFTFLKFTVDGVGVWLLPRTILRPARTIMSTTVNLGHTISMSIAFLDQNGNPMLTTPTPDSPPVWTNTTPATETVAAAANGLTAVATPVAVGTDTVNLAVI